MGDRGAQNYNRTNFFHIVERERLKFTDPPPVGISDNLERKVSLNVDEH